MNSPEFSFGDLLVIPEVIPSASVFVMVSPGVNQINEQ
jgi:hypothetical protein